jgi:MYXO-CTERM domain-containing protein
MRHCNMLRAEWEMGSIRIGAAIVAALLLSAAPQAHAGDLIPKLSLVGGTGVPGSTVSVMVTLSDDPDSTATSADVDFTYPNDLVTFSPPVTTNCSVAERLADTHEVAGTLVEPGFLRLSILVSGTPVEFPPLGDGELASCDFHIEASAPVGTAALEIDDALLFAGLDELDVEPVDGAITISGPVSPTPTATGVPTGTATATVTPTGATPTRTNTQPTTPISTPTNTVTSGTPSATSTVTTSPSGGTATATPTEGTPGASPTRTNTGGAVTPAGTSTATRAPTGARQAEDDGCNVTPNGQSSSTGTLALLLAPALLIWARRRRF